MNWTNKTLRFSIRKLKVAVASTVVGIATTAIVGQSFPDHLAKFAPTCSPVTAQADTLYEQVTITYHYVNYTDLSSHEKEQLIDGKQFSQEIARADSTYILAYQENKGLLRLPNTGDQARHLIGLLAGLGITAVGLLLTKHDKKRVAKLIIICCLGGAVLTTANSRAIEAGLQAFLTETHLVTLGEQLPQPESTINGQGFSYYFPASKINQASQHEDYSPEDKAEITNETRLETESPSSSEKAQKDTGETNQNTSNPVSEETADHSDKPETNKPLDKPDESTEPSNKQEETEENSESKPSVPESSLDKSRLAIALTEAQQLESSPYTTRSWKNLQDKLIQAQAILQDSQSTQEQIDVSVQTIIQAISLLQVKKQVPSLTVASLSQDNLTKTATIAYQLTDPDNAFEKAVIRVYKDSEQVGEFFVSQEELSGKVISLADYNTPYSLRTVMVCTTDQTPQAELIDRRELTLSLKKLEIKDVDTVSLQTYQNGQLLTIDSFKEQPMLAPSEYMARVSSKRFKDILLPIQHIEETTLNGQPVYKVTTAFDQLIETSEAGKYREQFSFYVGKNAPLATNVNRRQTDYTLLPGASKNREIAYANTEKLLPFYNKETIVNVVNQIDQTDKLYTNRLLSVTPMIGDKLIADVSRVRTELNRLLLHFEDDSISYLPIAFKENFANPAVSEYTITGTNLIYTPNQFLSNYDNIIAAVLPSLENLAYKSPSMSSALAIDPKFGSLSDAMDKLYLEDSFNTIKSDLPNQLRQILATDRVMNTTGGNFDQYLIDYIQSNKERILLGLAYLNRWYDLALTNASTQQTTALKDMISFHQDFFGKPVHTLEWLVNLTEGKEGYELLNPANHVRTYAEKIAPNTGKTDLLSYLTTNRKLFTDFTDDNSWFKATTKAYIVEEKSKELPDQDVRVYHLLSSDREQNGILPLLTAKEGIYIITTMGSISYGMYDRYIDTSSSQSRAEQIEHIKERVRLTAERQARHFDAWYRLAPARSRDRIIKPMPVWDGYYVNNNQKWLPMFGTEANQAIRDFFGPIGNRAFFPYGAGQGAFADGTRIAFVYDKLLDDYGASVFTHETVHNNDGIAYLGGYDRRAGMGAENYALGLLQSSSYFLHAEDALTYNLIFDFSKLKEYEQARRYVNVSPDRFKQASDLKGYMSSVFDVLYTLDYAEAEAVLKQPRDIIK
ncbi:ZmpA/ZmpB/ZmpC family metallo-endopeptidase [Streptococcus sp. E29BA]|uniref:ZmpA/ZmpB/ZmpC family metallo-endopeptidase n=1 Tax=Streptococcus sp. E29BA TaxID=3278716 RepID=UPI00359CDEB0